MEAQENGNNGNQIARNGNAILFNRHFFPNDFLFGSCSAAYQFEGATKEGGRGTSIWDTFTHRCPGRIADGKNGDVAVDFFHQFKDDVKIMKKMGFDAFRLSISWPRILPSGKLSGGVNKEGIKFYNELIDELLANGIKPFVTLFHWDLPQPLDDEYGGFLNYQIVADYRDYAEVCFWEFGDRVKHWITFNEPYIFSVLGYGRGTHAPGRGHTSSTPKTPLPAPLHRGHTPRHEPTGDGNPATEPYIVSHHELLAHAAAAELYRDKFKESQKGNIGIVLLTHWMEPYNPKSQLDKEAQQRALDFMFGWFMDPLTFGEYPLSMRELVGNRLPRFSKIESEKLKRSCDFVGVNYYTARYVTPAVPDKLSYSTDPHVQSLTERNGDPIGPQVSDWIYSYPKGIYDLMIYIKEKYDDPIIYLTENGVSDADNFKLTVKEACLDPVRKDSYHDHLRYLHKAIEHGVQVKGFFAWSFSDNFEWADGYTVRFGLIYVDFKDANLTRYPKESAIWFMNFLNSQPKIIEL